jgi:hypothetical protein
MAGITETQDLINLFKTLAVQIKAAKQDGVINLFDLPKLAPVIAATRAALTGSEKVPAELADLTAEETSALLSDLADAVIALYEALFASTTPFTAEGEEVVG